MSFFRQLKFQLEKTVKKLIKLRFKLQFTTQKQENMACKPDKTLAF